MVRTSHVEYRNKVTIQNYVANINSVGEPIYTWSDYAVRRAKVVPLGGKETYRLNQYFADANNVFIVRYDQITKAINTKMKILYDSRTFEIQSVINVDNMSRELRIVCKELV